METCSVRSHGVALVNDQIHFRYFLQYKHSFSRQEKFQGFYTIPAQVLLSSLECVDTNPISV